MKWTFAVAAEQPVDEARSSASPFERSEFGAFLRFAWPLGACQINHHAAVACWDRFALIVEGHVWTLVDAERDDVRRIRVDLHRQATRLGVADGNVYALWWDGVLAIPKTDLETLEPGKHEVGIEQQFPRRRPDVRRAAIVERVERGTAFVVADGSAQRLQIDAERNGLTVGTKLVLGDELAPDRFAYVEVVGQPRRALPIETVFERVTVSCKRAQPQDPAAASRSMMAPLASEQVALLAQVADDDDIARGVLIDLLADRGDPDAATYALLRAGKTVSSTRRRAALGPLAPFFEVQFHCGLPVLATLVRFPPDDVASIAAMLGDLRLGLVVELHRANSPLPFYLRLLASGALLSLRRVSAPSHEALGILRKRHAGQLTHLAHVPLADQLAIAMLADTAFASVTHIELDAPRGSMQHLIPALAAAVPPLPARHIKIAAQPQLRLELARSLFPRFGELGFASLEIGGATLALEGERVVARVRPDASTAVAEVARANATR